MKNGLVNGFETILKAKAAIKLNLTNLLSKTTNGIPNPKVGNTLINVPIAAPHEISLVLALALANFMKKSFNFLPTFIFSNLI